MAHRVKETTPQPKTDIILFWVSFASAVLGAVDAIYLFVLKLTSIPGMCLGSGDCLTVNNSAYSELRGIPVSVIGLLAYLAILGLHILETRAALFRTGSLLLIFGISLAGTAFSAYLTWVELYVIHAICPFCVASAVLITIILVVAIIRLVNSLKS